MLDEAEVLQFYERTSAEVYRYASRLVGGDLDRAQDLVQETYLTLVRQVNGGRTEAVDIGWAITTCRSRFLDQLRRHVVVERARARAFDRSDASTRSDTDDATRALGRLGDDQRAALVLRYVDDLTVNDVAVAMGRSVEAVESLLVRARAALRAAYAIEREAGR